MIRRISIAILVTACFMLAGLLLLASFNSSDRAPEPIKFFCRAGCQGRSSLSGWTLRGMPYPARRTTVCWRISNKHAVRSHFWHQYHSRPENRHRSLVPGSFHPRDARRRGS